MMAKQRLFHSLRGLDRRLQKPYKDKVLCDRRPSIVQRTLGKRMDTQEHVCAIEPQPVHHAPDYKASCEEALRYTSLKLMANIRRH
ncbi:conserved hypothetical protein [Ricinus communis]|uniref:Uncharacterized protein n=1 Tax=Ricinus communis TaxID=3988 RepID=B9T5E1_RICCO|nr:conserved hypothetical protein [Ricinus communis]